MLFELSSGERNDLIETVIIKGFDWERREAILREDTLIVYPFVSKKSNRLCLYQLNTEICSGIMEVKVDLLDLNVSDSESLRRFFILINKELPLKFQRRVIENSLRKTLLWQYEKLQEVFFEMWQALLYGRLNGADVKS